MKIREITENKREFMPLLLLADEQEEMVGKYLDCGRMFLLEVDGEAVAECVVTDEGGGVLEIKNVATRPDMQGRGFGRALIEYVEEKFRGEFEVLRVGTGESPLTLPFYRKLGFVECGRIVDFFTDNYDHPIVECGVTLKDMVLLEKRI